MLVKTRAAKRLALWFVIKFGHSARGVFFSFLIINVVLSAFISATTVKAAILLPIFMVVAAVYGASNGNRNNFGRNIVLQNLFQINIGASGFLTGSGANLLAASLIGGALGITSISYTDWFAAAFPMCMLLLIIGWWVGTKLIFPIPAALLYTTNHYSWSDTFKYGITMMLIGWVVIILWGETVLRWLGYTEGLFF